MNRRGFLKTSGGVLVASAAVITTPGLLMPVKSVSRFLPNQLFVASHRGYNVVQLKDSDTGCTSIYMYRPGCVVVAGREEIIPTRSFAAEGSWHSFLAEDKTGPLSERELQPYLDQAEQAAQLKVTRGYV